MGEQDLHKAMSEMERCNMAKKLADEYERQGDEFHKMMAEFEADKHHTKMLGHLSGGVPEGLYEDEKRSGPST